MMTSGGEVRVGIVGAGPSGLLVANALVRAGIDCVVYERLAEEAVRARTRAGLIEARTVALLDRHGLAEGLHRRGATSGVCEFRRAGVRHVLDYGVLAGAVHHVYPQQLVVADLLDALRAGGGPVRFGCPVAHVRLATRPLLVLVGGEEVACEFVLGCDGFHGIAAAAQRGELDVVRLRALEPEEAMCDLQRLEGIGPFYSALVVIRALGHADVLPADEPQARALAGRLYGLGHEASAANCVR